MIFDGRSGVAFSFSLLGPMKKFTTLSTNLDKPLL